MKRIKTSTPIIPWKGSRHSEVVVVVVVIVVVDVVVHAVVIIVVVDSTNLPLKFGLNRVKNS